MIKEVKKYALGLEYIGTNLKGWQRQKKGKRLIATFTDGERNMELVWFRGHKWIKESLKLNINYVILADSTGMPISQAYHILKWRP